MNYYFQLQNFSPWPNQKFTQVKYFTKGKIFTMIDENFEIRDVKCTHATNIHHG